jgi:hypothetical protein
MPPSDQWEWTTIYIYIYIYRCTAVDRIWRVETYVVDDKCAVDRIKHEYCYFLIGYWNIKVGKKNKFSSLAICTVIFGKNR